MQATNPLPPGRMTPEQRRREIAALLAQGLIRLRSSDTPALPSRTSEGGFSLGFSGQQSVHTDPVNNPRTASR